MGLHPLADGVLESAASVRLITDGISDALHQNSTIYAGGYAARHNHLAGSFPNSAHLVRAADLCPLLLLGRT
jgi:hypothetical protein